MKVDDISELGRITSGVKLINMDDTIVASMTKVRESATEESLRELELQMKENDGQHISIAEQNPDVKE